MSGTLIESSLGEFLLCLLPLYGKVYVGTYQLALHTGRTQSADIGIGNRKPGTFISKMVTHTSVRVQNLKIEHVDISLSSRIEFSRCITSRSKKCGTMSEK